MKWLLPALFLPLAAWGQNCAPTGALVPGGTVESALDDASCRLPDGTPYAAWRLTLPVRGQVQLEAAAGDVGLQLRDGSGTLVEAGKSIRRNLERGAYVVEADSSATGAPGGYSIRAAFTAEPGTMCRDFASVGLNGKVSGVLGASGCTAPDGTPYEAYSLHTLGGGTLDIAATGDITASLTLRGDDGRALATGSGSLSYPVQGDSALTLVVAGDPAGAYQLTTAFRPDPIETCRPQMSFDAAGRHAGTINPQSCTQEINDIGDVVYFNYYELKMAVAGVARINVSSPAFDPIVSLLDSAGNPVSVDRLSGGRGRSSLRLTVPAGNYLVRVEAIQPSGGAYSLDYSFSSEPGEACPLQSLSLGDTTTGRIGEDNCRSSLGPADLYMVTLSGPGTLDIAMGSSELSAILAIRDMRGNTLVWDDAAAGLGSSRLVADLPAGTYTIVAAANSNAGTYLLVAKFTGHDLAACAAPIDIPPNRGYIQMLGSNPCRGSNGQPLDTYQFTLPTDGTVAAVMTSSFVDGWLTLTDPAGTGLRTDDNGFSPLEPIIVQYLPAGTYRLTARASQTSFAGIYEVDVLFQPGSRPPGCGVRGTLEVGNPVSGNINYAGCLYPDDTFADVYSFTLQDTATVDVGLQSADFDGFLVLLDGKGNRLDSDDDSGEGSDALIQRTLPAGTYFVVAKPSQDLRSQGDYSIFVRSR